MRTTCVAIVAGVLGGQIAGAAPPVGKPVPKGWDQPALLRSYKEMLYQGGGGSGGQVVAPFNATKGQLRSVSGDFSGSNVVKATLIGAPGADYAFTTTCYAYTQGDMLFVNMVATGSGKAVAGAGQMLSAPAKGAGTFEATMAKKVFAGPGAIPLHMTCDGPKFTKGGDLFKIEDTGAQAFGGSVTYTYLPILRKLPVRPK